MSDAAYTWHVGTLVDGRITNELQVSAQSSWQTVMDDSDTLTAVVALSDPQMAGLNLRTAAEPARCFLAVAYLDTTGTETFLAAGPIWTHSYDQATKLLTIRASGLWSLFDHRYILPVLSAGVNPATITTSYTALSLGTIAKRLLQLAATHTGGSVPVVLPADETGVNERDYTGYSMTAIGAELRNLAAADGGPEIQFVPQRSATDARYLQWVMRAGTTEQPLLTQAGDPWTWDLSAVKGSASGVTVTLDGSATAGRQWASGSGSDVSTMFSEAEDDSLTTAGFPLLEAYDGSHSDVTDQPTLDGYAASDLQQANKLVETWTVTVQRDGTPTVSSYRVGDMASVVVGDDDPYIPAGPYDTRITGLSGDTTNQVKVSLQQTLDAA